MIRMKISLRDDRITSQSYVPVKNYLSAVMMNSVTFKLMPTGIECDEWGVTLPEGRVSWEIKILPLSVSICCNMTSNRDLLSVSVCCKMLIDITNVVMLRYVRFKWNQSDLCTCMQNRLIDRTMLLPVGEITILLNFLDIVSISLVSVVLYYARRDQNVWASQRTSISSWQPKIARVQSVLIN